jgi:hypothetical protein
MSFAYNKFTISELSCLDEPVVDIGGIVDHHCLEAIVRFNLIY